MKALAILHIPRTGGTSIRKIAKNNVPKEETVIIKDYSPNYESITARLGPHLRLIFGHMNYGIHRLLPVRYATILREPVARCISRYSLTMLRNPENHSTPSAFDRNLERKPDYHNCQARIIAGVYEQNVEIVDDELLAVAKQNLETFEIVGFTNELAEFVRKIGWSGDLPRKNVLSATALSRNQIERIRELNRVDIALYEWSRKRFAE